MCSVLSIDKNNVIKFNYEMYDNKLQQVTDIGVIVESNLTWTPSIASEVWCLKSYRTVISVKKQMTYGFVTSLFITSYISIFAIVSSYHSLIPHSHSPNTLYS